MTALPSFAKPPVVEVAISLQFDRLEKLNVLELGLLWDRYFRKNFPKSQFQPPLQSVFEDLEAPSIQKAGLQFEMMDTPPEPRVWFVNDLGCELVQVQRDRLVHNWRKAKSGTTYPRYPALIKAFRCDLDAFNRFAEEEGLGKLIPNQCELTYVNQIPLEGWKDHGDLHSVISPWRNEYSDNFLNQPEDVRFGCRYRIVKDGKVVGRLHVTVDPVLNAAKEHNLMLTLIARGPPISTTTDDVFQFLDLAHEWIVRGFASLTTPAMHKTWERTQ